MYVFANCDDISIKKSVSYILRWSFKFSCVICTLTTLIRSVNLHITSVDHCLVQKLAKMFDKSFIQFEDTYF